MTIHPPGGPTRLPQRLRCLLTLLPLCAALSGPATAANSPADQAFGASLHGLLDHARGQSPELVAMRLEADAAAQRVGPAGALPDPVLRMELMNFNNYGNDAAPSLLPNRVGETRYTVMQSIIAWGKRGLRRDMAAADARQADARADAAWIELATRIKAAQAERLRNVGSQVLTREVLDLMARLEQVAQARYAGGLSGQQDVLRAQLERSAMQNDLIMLAGEAQQLQARMNALLARDTAAPLADPAGPRPLPPLTAADAMVLADRARERNPLLAAERARVAAAQTSRELTQRNRYPDFVVGLSPAQMGWRLTSWNLMLEMNIPLQQDSRRGQEREAQAMVDAAQARTQALSRQLQGELGVNLAALDSARRTEALLQNQLLPQSELALKSVLLAYESGKAEFAMVLEAQRQIRRARQDLLKTQVEAQMQLAEIERIVGEDL